MHLYYITCLIVTVWHCCCVPQMAWVTILSCQDDFSVCCFLHHQTHHCCHALYVLVLSLTVLFLMAYSDKLMLSWAWWDLALQLSEHVAVTISATSIKRYKKNRIAPPKGQASLHTWRRRRRLKKNTILLAWTEVLIIKASSLSWIRAQRDGFPALLKWQQPQTAFGPRDALRKPSC